MCSAFFHQIPKMRADERTRTADLLIVMSNSTGKENQAREASGTTAVVARHGTVVAQILSERSPMSISWEAPQALAG